jgi:transposase
MTDDKSFNQHEKQNRLLKEENERLRKELEKALLEKKNLEKECEELKKELISLKSSMPFLAASENTAEACGVPSSKIFYRRNRQEGQKRPTGGQPGHPGHWRKMPIPNVPPLTVKLKVCSHCGNPHLGKPVKNAEQKRTITDTPPPSHNVYEVIYLRYWCNICKKLVRGEIVWLPSHQPYGPSMAAWVAAQRMLGLSVGRVESNLLLTYNLSVSDEVILKLEKWVADALGEDYDRIRTEIQKAKALGGDETQFRINGMNGWMWVFTSVLSSLYKIAPTRGHVVPEDLLKDFKGNLIRDAWKSYDGVECSDHQLDLLHANRWLERAEIRHRIEPRSILTSKKAQLSGPGRPPVEFIQYADGIRAIFKDAIEFSKSRPEPAPAERERAWRTYKRRMGTFLRKGWTDRDAVRISKELLRRLDMLFTFVKTPGVPWHNNDAERAIRQGVLHRKNTGGRRTWKGARALEILLTIYETAKKKGIFFVEWVVKALKRSAGVAAPAV